jgi:hypothetical protein
LCLSATSVPGSDWVQNLMGRALNRRCPASGTVTPDLAGGYFPTQPHSPMNISSGAGVNTLSTQLPRFGCQRKPTPVSAKLHAHNTGMETISAILTNFTLFRNTLCTPTLVPLRFSANIERTKLGPATYPSYCLCESRKI